MSGNCYTAMLRIELCGRLVLVLVDGCGSSRSDVSVVAIVSVVVFEDKKRVVTAS